ncbi:MAG: 30S ribosomal protein S6, partial [Cyanobium sp. LacPavin_0920_WC12_MAG_62_9]|nr:30S ribosomal protein S6 [Cyanobium sp. LacPavin_0920_WC12_MAG_62_9]
GVVLDCQMRGKRRLAYSIAKHREGIYVQLNHDGDGQQVATMERAMRLSEDVIRYLTIKQDGHMPAPRAIPGTPSEAATMAPAASTEEVTAAV